MSKIDEILENFQNGPTRYDNDEYFKQAITSLQMGLGVYAVLDCVLREHSALKIATAHRVQRLEDELASYKDALELTKKQIK